MVSFRANNNNVSCAILFLLLRQTDAIVNRYLFELQRDPVFGIRSVLQTSNGVPPTCLVARVCRAEVLLDMCKEQPRPPKTCSFLPPGTHRLFPRCLGGTGNSSPMVYRCGGIISSGKKRRQRHRVEGKAGIAFLCPPARLAK